MGGRSDTFDIGKPLFKLAMMTVSTWLDLDHRRPSRSASIKAEDRTSVTVQGGLP
jgi:hypothetical protein